MRTLSILGFIAITACAPPDLGKTTQALSGVTNGSFESGDYAGWTLSETGGGGTNCGTYGIATKGQVVAQGSQVFDFFDNILVFENSPGLPITYDATDGTSVALQLQNCAQNHRMFQTVSVPLCNAKVRWDMAYNNHNAGFDDLGQFTAVHIRDASDVILATPFKTTITDPLIISSMTAFEADISTFAGQTVQLDFEHQVQQFFFDIAWDNIRIECAGTPTLTTTPSSHDFLGVRVGTTSAATGFQLANTGTAPLVITAISTSDPFTVTALALPVTVPSTGRDGYHVRAIAT